MKKRNKLALNCSHVVSCPLQQDSYKKHHSFFQGKSWELTREKTNYQESSTLELLQISQKKETNKTKWTGKYQLPVGKRSEPGHHFSRVMKHCERQCNSTTDNLHFFVMRLFGLFIMATRRQKMFLTCTKVLHQYIYPVSRK